MGGRAISALLQGCGRVVEGGGPKIRLCETLLKHGFKSHRPYYAMVLERSNIPSWNGGVQRGAKVRILPIAPHRGCCLARSMARALGVRSPRELNVGSNPIAPIFFHKKAGNAESGEGDGLKIHYIGHKVGSNPTPSIQ